MFARLKETIRILSYRPPTVHGPDAIIVEKSKSPPTSRFGRSIAFFLEGFILISAIGFAAGHLGKTLEGLPLPKTGVSLATLAGALGALLLWIFHALVNQLQGAVQKRLNLADKLAPYFGHKLEETVRTIRS